MCSAPFCTKTPAPRRPGKWRPADGTPTEDASGEYEQAPEKAFTPNPHSLGTTFLHFHKGVQERGCEHWANPGRLYCWGAGTGYDLKTILK